jgi:hypothetical protein
MLASPAELVDLERRVGHALDGRDPQLPVLGHGEITLVLGCPAEQPRCVAKRLPPFEDRARAESYGALVSEYVEALGRRGIECVDTEYHVVEASRSGSSTVSRESGADSTGWASYVVQPLLPPSEVGPEALRRRDAADGSGESVRDLLAGVVDSILGATDEHVGLDGQLSNWADTPDGLRYFDVTTPLLNDSAGETRLDLKLLTSTLPAPLAPVVRRFAAPSILAHYHSPRAVLVDLAANLHKERLGQWVGAVLVAANRHLGVPITPSEVAAYYRRDARTWELMLRMRMADRWIHRRLLHRRYGTLLPPNTER